MRSISLSPHRWSLATWSLAALMVGFGARAVRYLVVFPMWGDEAFMAINFITRDFADMVGRLEYGMVVPLGFMWLNLAATELLGHSEWALRFVPWLAGMVGMFLVYRIATKQLGRHAAVAAVALFAASYYPIRHAAEVKPYSFDLLIALVIIWATLPILSNPTRRSGWVVYIGITILAIWFSYPSVFVAAGAYLAIGLRILKDRRPATWVLWFGGGVGFAASFLLMWLLIGSNQEHNWDNIQTGQWGRHFPPLANPLRLLLWLVYEHTGNMFAYPNGGKNYGSIATTLLVVVGSVALWRKGKREFVLLLLLSLPVMFVASALHKYPYGGTARTNQHLAGPICLLAGSGVVALLRYFLDARRTIVAVRIFIAAMVVFALASIVSDVVKPYKRIGDVVFRDAIRELAQRSEPDDRWMLFGSFADNGPGPDLRKWGGSAAQLRYHLYMQDAGQMLWDAHPATATAGDGGRLWLIVYRDEEAEFPEEQWQSYKARMIRRLGEPVDVYEDDFLYHNGKESAAIYEFAARTP